MKYIGIVSGGPHDGKIIAYHARSVIRGDWRYVFDGVAWMVFDRKRSYENGYQMLARTLRKQAR
jgi:hypothetical protein